jgi:hypothetical protein
LTLTVPPLRGPLPQGLNVPLKQVKTVLKSENINGRQRQYRQGSTERRSRSRIAPEEIVVTEEHQLSEVTPDGAEVIMDEEGGAEINFDPSMQPNKHQGSFLPI